MKKGLLIFLIVLAVLTAGFLYFWYFGYYLPNKPQKMFKGQEPPTLLGKDDYVIEDRADAKYVLVPKVGLTAKVPEGWTVEKETNNPSTPQANYWLEILSPNAEKRYGILINGCGFNISSGNNQEAISDIKKNIQLIQQNPDNETRIKLDYKFEIITIDKYNGLKWTAKARPQFGQAIGIEIPKNSKLLISINSRLPESNTQECLTVWDDFLLNLEMQ